MVPELDCPPQTPKASSALGAAQQRPLAASAPAQQPPAMSITVPLPPQTPQMSSFLAQQLRSLSRSGAVPPAPAAQQAPLLLTTPALHPLQINRCARFPKPVQHCNVIT